MAVASASKEPLDKPGFSPSRSSKQESESASETSSVHSGDATDRRDVDVMSSRSEEYRLLFRLPPDEVLVQDFNCALQENILLQGHMYLFIHHVCFYSNIFGFETKKIIPFHEVTCVRKAKTAAIFPNAIEIVTGEKKHFFGSFLSRDEAYRLIVDGWAQHNSDAKALLDHQESKSESSQDSASITLERVTDSPQLADASSSIDRSKDANDLVECKPLLNGKSDNEVPESSSEYQENGANETADCSSSSREPITWETEDFDAPKIPDHFSLVIEAKLPVSVEEFFNLFISDRASDFLCGVHRRCGDKDFQCTPWRRHEEFVHARDLSFLHPVKVYIGAKFGRCQELQKYRVYRNSHLVIETSQQISDVPFSDYFLVERIWDVENNDSEENGCILRVYFNVAFSKKTLFKGKIEQSTRDELREVHALWIKNARELLKQKNELRQKGSAQNTVLTDQDGGLRSSSKPEDPHVAPHVENSVQENVGDATSVASLFKESWATLLSHIQSQRHLSLYLIVATVATLMLMQITIIVLLTRAPQIHLVTAQGNQMSSLSGYSLEKVEWLETRVHYLKEEMLMAEARLERMNHEHALLKSHLQSLERLKPNS